MSDSNANFVDTTQSQQSTRPSLTEIFRYARTGYKDLKSFPEIIDSDIVPAVNRMKPGGYMRVKCRSGSCLYDVVFGVSETPDPNSFGELDCDTPESIYA